MVVTQTLGGFYGDEGKVIVNAYLVQTDQPDLSVRNGGGPQAGGTFNGEKVTQISPGFLYEHARLLVGRGTVLNPETILSEIEAFGVAGRIGIDKGCTIVKPEHIKRELDLVKRIGSVGKGVGPARVDRLNRLEGMLAKDVLELEPYLTDVAEEVNTAFLEEKDILLSGVHGYGLSLLDHRFYPNVTSQDTTASQFLADVGLGPKAVDEIVVVLKAYVSRVGNGPLKKQWSPEKQEKLGIHEKGTVSGRDRRLGDFDYDMAAEAVQRNTGTQVAITCVDRLFEGNEGVTKYSELTREAQSFVEGVDSYIRDRVGRFYKGVTLISTGPKVEDMVDLRRNAA